MKKVIFIIGGVLLAIVVIAVIVISLSLGKIVKVGVETVGPKIVQVPVKVDDVKLSLFTGSASVKGLVVGNPDGYKSTNAISVGLASVSIDQYTVLSDKIVIHSVVVQSPEITFEGGLNENNLSKIMDNVSAVSKTGGPVSTNQPAGAKSKPAKKIEIDDFVLTGARVHVILTGLGGKEMNINLPSIHLTDLGKGGAGLTATDLTRRILSAITTATVKEVAKSVADVGKTAEDLSKQGVDQVKKTIGGLFGK